jgi:phosphoglycerate dehydrogenase-like enzyme
MRVLRCVTSVVLGALLATATPALSADESKVDAATHRVETGAKMIGHGAIGKGVEETAKGIGFTVVEGAKFTGEKFKEAGKAAGNAPSFPESVKTFFTRLFSN